MKWAEVSVVVARPAVDIVAQIFDQLGAGGVVIEDPEEVNACIDAGLWDFEDIPRTAGGENVTVKAYLPADESLDGRLERLRVRIARMQAVDGLENGPCTIDWQLVQDEDWADNWKQYFHVDKVGEHIVIQPSWEAYTPQAGDIVLKLDPGAASGTGTHPTTAMCLRALERLVQPGARVFDVGTGSGVLAIAAAKLGAGTVVACDYDQLAVTVAKENIAANGVQAQVQTGVSDLLQNFSGQAELIIANIIADIVIRLLDELDAHLAPGGQLLASGIIDEREADVRAAVTAHGLQVAEAWHDHGWVALLITRATQHEACAASAKADAYNPQGEQA